MNADQSGNQRGPEQGGDRQASLDSLTLDPTVSHRQRAEADTATFLRKPADGKQPQGTESGIIGGDYEPLREIARGGMGRVLAAHDLRLDREVALKVLLPGANADRFVRESKITARLPHPGIPPVYAFGTLADGSPFLAMKLIIGRTLAETPCLRCGLVSKQAARGRAAGLFKISQAEAFFMLVRLHLLAFVSYGLFYNTHPLAQFAATKKRRKQA